MYRDVCVGELSVRGWLRLERAVLRRHVGKLTISARAGKKKVDDVGEWLHRLQPMAVAG